MSLSAEAKACFERIKDADFVNDSRCTHVQLGIIKLLTKSTDWTAGGLYNSVDLPVGDGVFGLRIHPVNCEAVWQHGVTIVRAGGTPCIYQAWVDSYSLSQWLKVAPPNDCNSVCFQKYAPNSQFFEEDPVEQTTSWMSCFAPLKQTYDAADFEKREDEKSEAFAKVVSKFFGVSLEPREYKLLLMAKRAGRELQFEWRKFNLAV